MRNRSKFSEFKSAFKPSNLARHTLNPTIKCSLKFQSYISTVKKTFLKCWIIRHSWVLYSWADPGPWNVFACDGRFFLRCVCSFTIFFLYICPRGIEPVSIIMKIWVLAAHELVLILHVLDVIWSRFVGELWPKHISIIKSGDLQTIVCMFVCSTVGTPFLFAGTFGTLGNTSSPPGEVLSSD